MQGIACEITKRFCWNDLAHLPEIAELSDTELDAVAGGAAVAVGGLVNLALNDVNVAALNNLNLDLTDVVDITVRNVANNNNISVGALINVLGGPSAILTRQTM